MQNKKGSDHGSNTRLADRDHGSALKEFFIEEIKDIYWAEKHLVKTIPKMQKAADSQELQTAFSEHLEATKGHVSRLEHIFELVGQKPVAKECEAMAGIIKEGHSIIDETQEGPATRDVGLILAAQKVEHYEISTYGGLAQLARTLGFDEVAEVLDMTLSEEKQADELLTSIAEHDINYSAVHEVSK